MDRRRFFGLSAAAGSLLAVEKAAGQPSGPTYNAAPKMDVQEPHIQQQQFRIGYTTNTRGGWEGSPFDGISEARDVGFRYFEIFGSSFCATPDGLEPASHDTQAMKTWPGGYSWKFPKGPRAKREVCYPDRCRTHDILPKNIHLKLSSTIHITLAQENASSRLGNSSMEAGSILQSSSQVVAAFYCRRG